jgi:hypothetical protein
MFIITVINETSYLILGPKNNYIQMTVSPPNKHNKRNLDAYLLFQNDLNKNIKGLKNTNKFSDFIDNVDIIWEKIPPRIKEKYATPSKEPKI